MEKHSVVIIGGGPAALTCARYLDLASVDYIQIASILGGNLFKATNIYNFPTYREIEGSILATEMVETSNVDKIEFDTVVNYKDGIITCESGKTYKAECIVVATGSNPIKLAIEAPCIHYCAICDGVSYKGKNVIVLGSGESAAQTAIYLSSICKDVFMVYRRDKLKVTEYTKSIINKKNNIQLYSGKVLDSITPLEDNQYNFVFSSNHGETDFRLIVHGCFVCWGYKPATEFLIGSDIVLDENGYIVHGDGIIKPYTATTEDGVFSCGDVLQGTYKQLVTSIGSGATCALDVIKYLEGK